MPTFRYKAYDGAGKATGGDIEAVGVKDALLRLKGAGLYPSEVREALPSQRVFPGTGRVSRSLLALTTRQLGTLLASGSMLADAIAVLADNTGDSTLKPVLLRVRDSVLEGRTLGKALEDHRRVFSPFYTGIVAAGEASGTLDGVLLRLSDHLDARATLERETKSALAYPALMTLVGAGVISFLFIFVMPKITRIFEDTQTTLPWITVVLIWITEFIGSYWPFVLTGLMLAMWGLSLLMKRPWCKELKDRLLMGTPGLGTIMKEFYISNLARTLGSLLKGGVPLLKALDITRGVLNNVVFDEILSRAKNDCMEGAQLAATLKTHKTIPSIVVHMVSVGEKSGELDEMLLKIADTYEQEFTSDINRALSLLEPFLVLAMGLVVGFLVLAILLPIFQLNLIVR